jgi:hypothetical protein
MDKDPYSVYMTMCELGMRFPNADEDPKITDWYTFKTRKDIPIEIGQCGKRGWPDCPEDLPYGDQDCKMIRDATLHMTTEESNAWFCGNFGGHTVFQREAPRVWAQQIPLKQWKNSEARCKDWNKKNAVKTLEALSNRTLTAAELGSEVSATNATNSLGFQAPESCRDNSTTAEGGNWDTEDFLFSESNTT